MQVFLGKPLHSDKKATALPLAPGPLFDVGIELFPPAQVKVSDAEIGATRELQRLLKRWEAEVFTAPK